MNDRRGPRLRPRRLRRTAALRDTLAEVAVAPADMIAPAFVVDDAALAGPIASLPGVERMEVEALLRFGERALDNGIRWTLLFGVVGEERKDAEGGAADDPAGPVAKAVAALKNAFGGDLLVATDVCLCAYTDHGHCGLLAPAHGLAHEQGVARGHASARRRAPSGELEIDNDRSLRRLAAMAVSHARAGADLVAPSDMMDGRVAAIRTALDEAEANGVGILSYAVKYASAFYGPFRDAACSSPGAQGHHELSGPRPPRDRASYQMDPRNAREALREVALDVAEGADLLMIKPALPYLDVLSRVRAATFLPLVAYQVSGEYAMLKAAARGGVLEECSAMQETLLAIRRAGADLIVSYGALEAAEAGWLT